MVANVCVARAVDGRSKLISAAVGEAFSGRETIRGLDCVVVFGVAMSGCSFVADGLRRDWSRTKS